MNKRFNHGLVVGKFSPLHRGHEMLIQRALEECDHVAIISYASPELPGCGFEHREQWLRSIFPQTQRLIVTDDRLKLWFPEGGVCLPPDEAKDTIHRIFVARLCCDVLKMKVDAVFTSEDYGDGFARELTGLLGCNVTHVLVDQQRNLIPVSGTLIRCNVHEHREFMSTTVYSSFIKKVCIHGGESSGKSTLSAALAVLFDTVYVPEYGRELWEERSGHLVFDDMIAIAREQSAREDAALLSAKRYLFCDTSPLTTLFYSNFMFGKCASELYLISDRHYDLTVLCEPDFTFVQDGTRQPPGFREQQHEWYINELVKRKVPFIRVNGGVEERVAQIAGELTKLSI